MTDYDDYSEWYDRPLKNPKESPKQFQRYMVYRNMPKLERSVVAACGLLNEAGDDVSDKTLANTATKFKWFDRAKAYDIYLANLEIEVLETGLEEAVQYVLGQEDVELVMATRLVQKVLKHAVEGNYSEALSKESEADRAKKIIGTLDSLQRMRRRRAGLPSNYTSKDADPQNFEEQTFIIGTE